MLACSPLVGLALPPTTVIKPSIEETLLEFNDKSEPLKTRRTPILALHLTGRKISMNRLRIHHGRSPAMGILMAIKLTPACKRTMG